MPRTRMPDVLVMHSQAPMRMLLHLILVHHGYTVTDAPTYAAALWHLRTTANPTVMVAGNWAANYQAEVEFFGRAAMDATLPHRHRYVLLTTIPEWLPKDLDATLRSLGVLVRGVPVEVPDLLAAVAAAACCTPAEGAPAGW